MSRKRLSPSDEQHLVVRSSSMELPHGFRIDHHAHSWHQLLFATAGVMTVETPLGHWVVPPACAVWLPSTRQHAIVFSGASALRTLYLRPEHAQEVPSECCALSVSPLLRELIVRTTDQHALDERSATDRALALLIVNELRRVEAPPLELMSPRSPALLKLIRLLADPAANLLTTPRLARKIGLGVRTLERRFLVETGMTLLQWRRQAKMLRALEQLLVGDSLKVTAERSGYASASAFIAAFRMTFGTTPRRYLARLVDGAGMGPASTSAGQTQ
jgi:AraC-like DNA-binding protein